MWPLTNSCCHNASYMDVLLEGKGGKPVSPCTLQQACESEVPAEPEQHTCSYIKMMQVQMPTVEELKALTLPRISTEGPKPGTPEGEAALLRSLFTVSHSVWPACC